VNPWVARALAVEASFREAQGKGWCDDHGIFDRCIYAKFDNEKVLHAKARGEGFSEGSKGAFAWQQLARLAEAKLAEAQDQHESTCRTMQQEIDRQTRRSEQVEASEAKLREAGSNLAKPADRLHRYCEKGDTICFDNDSDLADAERYAAYLATWDAALAASPEEKP
jgi:hypothetical protein